MDKKTYSKEERKTYNQNYYKLKKQQILDQQGHIEECCLCGRKVRHQYINVHQNSKICLKNRDNKILSDIMQIKKELENIKSKIIEKDELLSKEQTKDNGKI